MYVHRNSGRKVCVGKVGQVKRQAKKKVVAVAGRGVAMCRYAKRDTRGVNEPVRLTSNVVSFAALQLSVAWATMR